MDDADDIKNAGTILVPAVKKVSSAELLKKGFQMVADQVLEALESCTEGFVLAAVDTANGEVHVARARLGKGELDTIVLGRHMAANMALTSDVELSLRHLIAVLTYDKESGHMARVLDLRSSMGMTDAHGRQHFSVAANGPVALRASNSALFVLPGNLSVDKDGEGELFDRIPWPDSEPWIPTMPPEKYITERSEAMGSSSMVSMLNIGTGKIRPTPRPQNVDRIGMLRFEAGDDSFDFGVDRVDLRAGVLIGRYLRCDLSINTTPMPKTVSRVHALLIAVDERPHIFDTGSTNGLKLDDFPIKALALPEHQHSRFVISENAAIIWIPG